MKVNDSKGFTILELLIVMSVAIIISNVTAKSFLNLELRNLNKACLKLQSEILSAKSNSIMEGTSYRMFFDIQNNRYIIYKTDESDKYVHQKTVYFTDNVKLIHMNDSNKNIIYTPVGTTNNACTITLRTKQYSAHMTVNVGSGRIEVKEFIKL